MIFVPCAGGISHNEAESTSFDECAADAQVLLNAVLEFDRRLGESRNKQVARISLALNPGYAC
jgi:hypothetical protein